MSDLILYDKDQIEYIGDFEPDLFIMYMSKYRKFNKDQIINYLVNIYKCDPIIIKQDKRFNKWIEMFCKQKENIYEEFYKNNDYRNKDDCTREYFNKKIKPIYYQFSDKYFDVEKCQVSGFLHSYAIHHIYPLSYGGNNHLENLVYISDAAHKILHENPKEESEQMCHVALDHLMLTFRGYKYFMVDAMHEANQDENKAYYIYFNKIRNKMNEYYTTYFI